MADSGTKPFADVTLSAYLLSTLILAHFSFPLFALHSYLSRKRAVWTHALLTKPSSHRGRRSPPFSTLRWDVLLGLSRCLPLRCLLWTPSRGTGFLYSHALPRTALSHRRAAPDISFGTLMTLHRKPGSRRISLMLFARASVHAPCAHHWFAQVVFARLVLLNCASSATTLCRLVRQIWIVFIMMVLRTAHSASLSCLSAHRAAALHLPAHTISAFHGTGSLFCRCALARCTRTRLGFAHRASTPAHARKSISSWISSAPFA